MKTTARRCVCGKSRPKLAVLTNNPYCSRICAEAAYGIYAPSRRELSATLNPRDYRRGGIW